MKFFKPIKILSISIIISAYFSLVSILGDKTFIKQNFPSNYSNISSELNDSEIKASDSSSYTHTNYASFSKDDLPISFNFNCFAQTNSSMLVQTDKGFMGLLNNNKIIIFLSYSGRIIWIQNLSKNQLIQSFCNKNQMSYSNLQVQQWTYLSNNGINNWVSFLVSDGNKQATIAIDLDSGLFVPNNVDNNLVLKGDDVFKVISDSSGSKYRKIFQIGQKSLLAFQDTLDKPAKLISYNNTGTSISDITINLGNAASKLLCSIIYTGSKTYALLIDKTGTISGDKVNFNQRLYSLSLSNNVLGFSGQWTLTNNYVVLGTNTTLTSVDDFKSRFFIKKNNDEMIFISGSAENNYIEIYKSSTPSKVYSISLSGYDLNSITYSPNFDKLYIGNNKSTNNVYLSYVDLNSSNHQLITIQQSTENKEKKYFLVPILESKSKEYLIKMSSGVNNPTYMIYSNNSYSDVTNSIMPLKEWYLKDDISTSIGQAYTPNGITDDVIISHLNINLSSGGTLSQKSISRDLNNGTVKYELELKYPTVYDSSIGSSFTMTFYIQGLAKSSSYVFNWIDDNTTSGSELTDKAKKIAELKNNNYSNKITAKDVLDYFISYDIKNKNGSAISINESMISLTPSSDYGSLTITVNLSNLNLPIGTSSSNLKQTKTYNGFLSTNKYSATSKDDISISKFTKTIYPSKLNKEQVVQNFLSTNGLKNEENYWNITITNVNDFTGTFTITASYINPELQIDHYDQLPSSYFNKFNNVINNKPFRGFKSLSSQDGISSKPTIEDLINDENPNTYLPSEIWNQYVSYLNGDKNIDKNDVILLKKLSFTLTSVDDLIIDKDSAKVVDSESVSENNEYSIGYIQFNVSLKNGAKTSVKYDGTEYDSENGNLVVDQKLSKELKFPYTIKWNINTYNKFFILKDKRGNLIQPSDDSNLYQIDLNTNTNLFGITKSSYFNSVSINQIIDLIDTEGYNYNITSFESNLNKGYLKATIKLSLKDKPLVDGDLSNNPNFNKTIIIYNFKIPMSSVAQLLILLAMSFAISFIFILIISHAKWLAKKVKYKKLSFNHETVGIRQNKLKNISKKKRYFKG